MLVQYIPVKHYLYESENKESEQVLIIQHTG